MDDSLTLSLIPDFGLTHRKLFQEFRNFLTSSGRFRQQDGFFAQNFSRISLSSFFQLSIEERLHVRTEKR